MTSLRRSTSDPVEILPLRRAEQRDGRRLGRGHGRRPLRPPDLILAPQVSSYALTPAKIGIPRHTLDLLHFSHLLGWNKAKERFFTARPVRVKETSSSGLGYRLVPANGRETFTLGLTKAIAANAPGFEGK